jgi:hypothetical protein
MRRVAGALNVALSVTYLAVAELSKHARSVADVLVHRHSQRKA